MNESTYFLRLKRIIFEVFGIDDVELTTCVNKLGTVSEDNDRFLELFQKEFNVDMEQFSYYDFYEEDEFILIAVFKRLFCRNNKKEISIYHLLLVIDKGKWFDPF